MEMFRVSAVCTPAQEPLRCSETQTRSEDSSSKNGEQVEPFYEMNSVSRANVRVT